MKVFSATQEYNNKQFVYNSISHYNIVAAGSRFQPQYQIRCKYMQ